MKSSTTQRIRKRRLTSGVRVGLIAGHGPDGGLQISIVDTGVGMKPEDIPKALTEFGQVAQGLDQEDPSTGLGLPLARRLVDFHDGRLEILSEYGQGTTVTLTLPARRWLAG